VREFYPAPMLQQQHWAGREALQAMVYDNRWGRGSALFRFADEPGAGAVDRDPA
jgi:hypothetical protein